MLHSKDNLALELLGAGLPELADKARQGIYHDYLSSLPDPAMELDRDLAAAIKAGNPNARSLRARHHNGEFDATDEESDAWAESPEGQEAFRRLRSGE